jgi:hypothetical protein
MNCNERNDGKGIRIELYTPTIAREMPIKNKRWNNFSATNATQGNKARLHQTEHPNALPASWRCPGQPRQDVGNSFISVPARSSSVMDATAPAM